jgi:hypothetical protein
MAELIALVILARQVRGGRQPLEILGRKPRRVVRGGELGIRLRPRLRIKGLPPPDLVRRSCSYALPPSVRVHNAAAAAKAAPLARAGRRLVHRPEA